MSFVIAVEVSVHPSLMDFAYVDVVVSFDLTKTDPNQCGYAEGVQAEESVLGGRDVRTCMLTDGDVRWYASVWG